MNELKTKLLNIYKNNENEKYINNVENKNNGKKLIIKIDITIKQK